MNLQTIIVKIGTLFQTISISETRDCTRTMYVTHYETKMACVNRIHLTSSVAGSVIKRRGTRSFVVVLARE